MSVEPGNVHCMDALDLLRALPEASVDLVWIDPPYGNDNGGGDLAGSRARDKVRGGRRRGEITPIANDRYEDWHNLMPAVFREINRVLKLEASCCCCCGGGGPTPVFAQVAQWLDEYHDFFQAVVWDKSARGNGMGWRYRRNYEFVMVSHKRGGKLAWNMDRPARPNVFRYRPTNNDLHPTEKPVALVEEFILNHTQPGALVVDCFVGSGTTGVACVNTGRQFILADIDPVHVETARKRVSQPFTAHMFEAAVSS